jgi:hypothetical protein
MRKTIIITINESTEYDHSLAEISEGINNCLFDNFGIALANITEGEE